jgi:hypothetical protein
MTNNEKFPMQKAAFILTLICLPLTIVAAPLAEMLHLPHWFILPVVCFEWIVFGCVCYVKYVKIGRRLKQENQAIEEKHEARMKQLIAEVRLHEQ